MVVDDWQEEVLKGQFSARKQEREARRVVFKNCFDGLRGVFFGGRSQF